MKKSFSSLWKVIVGAVALFFALGAITLISEGEPGPGIFLFLLAGAAAYLLFKGKTQRGADNEDHTQKIETASSHTQTSIPRPQPQAKKEKGKVCPDCGKKFPLGQVYCDECGALLKEI